MAAIGGKKRETKEFVDFQKKVGVFEAEVVAVNPDKEELEKLLDRTFEEDKEIEYLGEKEGVSTVRIGFYLKEVKTGEIYNVSFFLENRTRTNKDETKFQFINSVGQTSWAAEEDDLGEWFTKDRDVRKAKVGEEELYNFLRNWLSKLDFRDADAVLSLDSKKLFKGNVKDIADQVGSEFTSTVVALATVKTKEVDGEVKSMQVINNKNFLPGYNIKFFNKKFTQKDADRIAGILKGDDKDAKKKVKAYERFIASVMDSEYPVKQFYGTSLTALHDYDEAENPTTSEAVVQEDDSEDSDY
jgi:hypothetical protein